MPHRKCPHCPLSPALPSCQEAAPPTVLGSLSRAACHSPPPGEGPSTGPGLGQCPQVFVPFCPTPTRFGWETWALTTLGSCRLVSHLSTLCRVLGRVQVV